MIEARVAEHEFIKALSFGYLDFLLQVDMNMKLVCYNCFIDSFFFLKVIIVSPWRLGVMCVLICLCMKLTLFLFPNLGLAKECCEVEEGGNVNEGFSQCPGDSLYIHPRRDYAHKQYSK